MTRVDPRTRWGRSSSNPPQERHCEAIPLYIYGGGGIRTQERLATPTVSETAAFHPLRAPSGVSSEVLARGAGPDRRAGRRRQVQSGGNGGGSETEADRPI